ncbi:MAG TPA: long-chain fatty acid--CoA ligase [Cyclobacteriaceae bacterium]|nr:long-chain fatty acid--CoA ligase [Cyclobacteriaceae bacterium]
MKGLMMDYQLTLPTILRRAETLFGDKEIVSQLPDKTTHRYTYRDFAKRAKKLSVALQRLGVRRGDRVATLCWNHYQHLETYFAVPCMGAIAHTLNARLSPDDLTYIVNHAEDKVIIVDQVLLPLFEKFRSATAIPFIIVIRQTKNGVPPGYLDYEDIVSGGDDTVFEPFEGDEYTAALMCYTSGTTGKPKGVLYSHRSIMLHSMSFLVSCTGIGISERDVALPVVPMFHASAWGFPFHCTFVGAKQVLPGPHLDAESLLGLFQSEKVTITGGVPTVMINILNTLDSNPNKYKLALRTILVGGSSMPKFLVQSFDERYNITVLHTWGMTEISPLGATAVVPGYMEHAPKEEQYEYATKQGLPVPFIEIRGRSEAGLIPWDGQTMGELEVRGPYVAAAYYRDPEPGGKFTSDGWLKTGDIVTITKNGCIEVKDRSKDVIKSGGEWISSVALENALMGHPSVLEAAVIAVPDVKWMERPFAYVVPKEGKTISPDELNEFLSDNFAKFWIPDGYAIVKEIPKTSVGKFLKSALRDLHLNR